jgi:ATP-dependent exoDNAse (exonuclease V) beta subunit
VTLADADARRRIRDDLDATLVVEAAAGTGKTTELVGRIAAVLRSGRARVDEILAVTFTDRAAGELKLRLRKELDGRGAAIEAARIGTIHSLCADLLRELPVEAGVDPAFEVGGDELFDEAFDAWFAAAVAAPGEGVRRALRRPPPRRSTAREELRRAARARVERRDFDAPWRRDAFDRVAHLRSVAARFPEIGARHDADAIEAELVACRRKHWSGELHQRLDDALAPVDADLAALVHAELGELVDRYEALKRRAGRVDFLDLLLRARDLLATGALAGRFSHVFVDESQDTDPLQADVLELFDARLFLVGDPKQSIYRFRRADIACYEALKAGVVARGGEVVQLTTSFRGVPGIQDAVNRAFAPRMRGAGHARYIPLTPHRPASAHPPVLALPVPVDLYPDGVAAFVRWLVDRSGWGFAPRDVCVLLRRFQSFGRDLTGDYIGALEARGLPHVLVGGRTFHDREEILALRTALAAIERPDDELSVYATLRGPLFGFADDELLVWRQGGDAGPVADALAILAELRAERNRRPVAETLARLLRAARAHAAFAYWRRGEDVVANVGRLGELARRFDASGASSFRAFVDALHRAVDEGQADPLVEEGTDGVRIMTVHGAKGLEFPVVILADPAAPATPGRPSRHVDGRLWAEPLLGAMPAELREHAADALARDAEEELRVAYVAATRARDLLVVPTHPGWADLLAPHAERFEVPLDLARPAPAGFDPWHGLADGPDAEAGERAHATWAARRDEIRAAASAATVPVRAGARGAADVAVARVATDPERPRGRRFGALVHALLASVPFDGDGVDALAAYHGRLLGASAAAVAAAVAAARAALAHPLLRRAAASDEVLRESPVYLYDAGAVVEGTLDLAFREGGAWTVVELKTEEPSAERHGAQGAAYAAALAAATGLPARAVILGV